MDSDKTDWDLEERDAFMDKYDGQDIEPDVEIVVASDE